jgi:o-succinylbenzoate synthase
LKVACAELLEVGLPLVTPFVSGLGRRHDRRIILVRLLGEDGREGWGECVAGEDPSYTAETTETAWHVLAGFILPALVGREILGPEEILEPVSWIQGHSMAKASAEMAAWDLQAKELAVSLRELLGGEEGGVPAALVIGFQAGPEALARLIEDGLARGYSLFKLKVNPANAGGLVRQVRDRFPDLSLAIDANGSFAGANYAEVRDLDTLGLEFIEQPLGRHQFLEHAKLQSEMTTPICLDESIQSEDELRLALELGACRYVSIKPGLVGGLKVARRLHDECAHSGVPVRLGGMLESGIGRAHNVALAGLPGFTVPGDLSESRRYWERDLVHPEFELRDGRMPATSGPGIGVTPDISRIRALAVRQDSFGDLP